MAITSGSARKSAPDAASAPPPARPVRPPTRCRLPDTLLHKLRAMLLAYHQAGGASRLCCCMTAQHGTPLIDALARHGDGLPANVLPLAVNEVTQVGLEAIVAAFAYGAAGVRFLLRAKPLHDVTGLSQTIAMADAILSGLGFSGRRVSTIETDDPDTLGEALHGIEPAPTVQRPATFRTVGKRRDLLRFALSELHRVAPAPTDVIALPEGAPLGAISVDVDGCTLCLSCVSACPTGALRDDPDRPALKFVEDACVQCGLCKSTCPEKVITLTPQIDFRAATATPGSSRKKNRRSASAATSRSASRARSTGSRPSSRAGTGCIPRATSGWTW